MTDHTAPGGNRRRLIRLRNMREATANGTALVKAMPAGFSGRWTRRHWVHASLLATLGALVAAIVPGFSSAAQAPAHLQRTTMSLSLPPLSRASKPAMKAVRDWQIVTVQKGETLSHVFERLEIPRADLQRVLDHPGARESLTRLHPGAELAFELPASGKPGLDGFRYDRDGTHRIELTLAGETVSEHVIERPLETRTVVVSGEVGSSLFHTARKLGLSGSTINALTDDIFKYDIDFNTDVASSDRFSVVVEQSWREGELYKSGPVLAATFTAHGKLYSGFRYERGGKAEYFSADGRPLKQSFIRMPIPYARITSGFGMRKHPILGRTRGHMGVDYAASTGTPIMAAGDARVAFVGWKGGYGRAVILDHGRGYTTLYGHMSGFGKIKVGQHVPQGTVIGRVGMTGLATGPHLHYEFRVNGVHRNPLSVTMPPPEPLSGTQLADFRAQTGPALARIEKMEKLIYADVPAKPDPAKRVASADRRGAKRG